MTVAEHPKGTGSPAHPKGTGSPGGSLAHANVVIIGAGVSGLGYANWWREAHPDAKVIVLEAESEPGGYCRTVVRDGFVWDYSGHFFHFKDPAIEAWLRARMPGQDIGTVERIAKIRYAGRDIDFPFQKHIHQLPQDEFIECLVELYFRPTGEAPPRSFGEMLYRKLGKGITEKFLRPYNEKLYAIDLDKLDVDAMGRFFPHADIADIIANMRKEKTPQGYNATFTYPAGGAIQYINALLRDLPAGTVAVDEPAVALDLAAHTVTTPRRTIRFDHVVSSAPLRTLAKICSVPHDASVFTSNKVLVFNLGFDRKGLRDLHWMYFPDPSLVFYRVGWYDNIIGGDRQSLYVEIGAPDGATFDVDALRARVLADLKRERIITDHQLVAHHHVVLDPAYVHITKSSLAETARLKALLAARDVHSVGRYGGWTYCSIEDNLLETRALATRL
ncbi:MAG: Protoporphyrinogen oxidase-like protein [Myxococcales bacterium]|nr:Protoporphyrinogen oxidase-like protein [Myxococcales bacterium]